MTNKKQHPQANGRDTRERSGSWHNQRVQIGMLGPFEVGSDDGAPADVPGARLRALLAALALRPGHVVPKASLVDWIWGEDPPADAANALQRLVSRLRKALPDASIDGHTDGYLLNVAPDAVDVVRFERLLTTARASAGDAARRAELLGEALRLWRGAPMADIGLADSGAFNAAAGRLAELRLAAAEERADAELGLGRGADLVTELTDLAAAHPVRERLAAALMRALVAAGRPSEALLTYERTRESLAEALGVDPSPELSALHVALLRGELGQPAQSRDTNLRAELTSFVGRDADVAGVARLLKARRLVTVLGPGGAGKTRLATETARTMLPGLPDGAWLVDLAPVAPSTDSGAGSSGTGSSGGGSSGGGSSGGDVAQAALTALGLRDAALGAAPSAAPADRFIGAVRDRDALLILDNCEHVIEAAAAFAHRVLGECRRLRILATSREPLGITGEALWLVEPLTLPAADAGPAEVAASPAVALLRDRAGAVRKDLGGDERTLATLARVCRALDGLPLAIELAAARLRTMSVEQLAARLDDRFRLLTSGSRTALPRHKTLRAVVDWSWELLSEPERAVARRLAVFAGGASLEAAERVCADNPDAPAPDAVGSVAVGSDAVGSVAPEDVLDLLTALTEKSLLAASEADDSSGAPRYQMTGTIREYAAERLAAAGEADAVRRAHLEYFTEFAEDAEPHLRRAEQLRWLAALEAEHDNLAAAMRGALAAGEAQQAMRLAAGAAWYWWLGGHRTEGVELVTAAANLQGEAADDVRALVYALVVHFLSGGRGDEHRLMEWIHRAYESSQRTQRRHPTLEVVPALERMLAGQGAFLTAFEPLLSSADPWVRALGRLHVGKARIMSGQGGRDADAYLETALAEFRALGDRFGIWFALTELADRTAVRGDLAAACQLYEQAVTVLVETGAVEDVIPIRSRQAQLRWLLGDADGSDAAMADAQRHADRVPWPDALAELALARAELARWRGDAEQARRQLDAATEALGSEAEQPLFRAVARDLLGYLADDVTAATGHRAAAYAAAAESGFPPLIARVLVGVADLALRRGTVTPGTVTSGTVAAEQEQLRQAVRLLAASDLVRGLPDRSFPDATRIEREARGRLGDAEYAAAAREGSQSPWADLAAVTLEP
jgi:predicted ATPase